jgi:hypothetical protein
MIKRFGYVIILSALLFVLSENGCNTISDSSVQTNSTFIPVEEINIIRDDTLFLFNPQEGYVVNFQGARSCTVLVNGEITSAIDNDSVYSRFITHKKGNLTINDSTYGRMEFTEQEINDWHLLLNEIKDSTDFIGTVLKESMDSVEFYTIKSYANAGELTPSNKVSIVNAFSQFVNNTNFYYDNKIAVDTNLIFSFMRDSFYNDVAHMVERVLFLDTNGTVKSNLTLFEEEEIKWFNWRIFALYFDPDPENTFKTKFHKYPACGRLFAMSFQQAYEKNKLPENEIVRYFEFTNEGMFQVVLKDNSGLHVPLETKINNYFFITSAYWKVTPLYGLSEIPFISGENVVYKPGNATIKYSGTSAFKDTTWFELKLYYTINKTVMQKGNPLDVKGTIVISAGLFKYKLGRNQGHFTSWDSDIYVYATNIERDVVIEYREKSLLKPVYN